MPPWTSIMAPRLVPDVVLYHWTRYSGGRPIQMDGGSRQHWNGRICDSTKCRFPTIHQLLPGFAMSSVMSVLFPRSKSSRREKSSRKSWPISGTTRSMAAPTRRGTSTTSPRILGSRTSPWCMCRTLCRLSPGSYLTLTPSRLMALSASPGNCWLCITINPQSNWSDNPGVMMAAYWLMAQANQAVIGWAEHTKVYNHFIIHVYARWPSNSWTWWRGRSMRSLWRKSNSPESHGPMTTRFLN